MEIWLTLGALKFIPYTEKKVRKRIPNFMFFFFFFTENVLRTIEGLYIQSLIFNPFSPTS